MSKILLTIRTQDGKDYARSHLPSHTVGAVLEGLRSIGAVDQNADVALSFGGKVAPITAILSQLQVKDGDTITVVDVKTETEPAVAEAQKPEPKVRKPRKATNE